MFENFKVNKDSFVFFGSAIIILAFFVGLFVVGVKIWNDVKLNTSGFCVKEQRMLSDEEFFIPAIRSRIAKWTYVEQDSETGANIVTSSGHKTREAANTGDFHAYAKSRGFANNLELGNHLAKAYYQENPDCCELKTPLRNSFMVRARGHAAKEVWVTNKDEYLNSAGDVETRQVKVMFTISNCGSVYARSQD